MAKAAESADMTEGTATPAPGRRKKAIALAAIGLIAVGAGGAAYYFITGSRGGDEAHHEEPAKPLDPPQSTFASMKEIVFQVKRDSRMVLGQVKMTIEIGPGYPATRFTDVEPRLADAARVYLATRTPADLSGAAAIYRLKADLLARFRAAAPEIPIKGVLFESIFVQ
jgi:flagellar basal body-associated protein FliL